MQFNTEKIIKIGFVINAILLVLTVGLIFFSLYSTFNLVYTGGDNSFYQQMYYNFYSERPFQSTVVAYGKEHWVNPNYHINGFVFHSYLLTWLLALPYLLFEDGGLLVKIILFLNLVGSGLLSYFILRHLCTNNVTLKWYIFIIVIICSGFLHYTFSLGVAASVAFTFILLGYYAFIKDYRYLYYFSCILLCLLQDDLSTFVVSSALYIFLFVPSKRNYAYFPIILGLAFFISWYFVLQPLVRADLGTVAQGVPNSMLINRLQERFESLTSLFTGKSSVLVYAYTVVYYLHSFVVMVFVSFLLYYFHYSKKIPFFKAIVFLIMIPMPYWIFNLSRILGYHTIPIEATAMILLLICLGKISMPEKINFASLSIFMFLFIFQIIIHIFTLDIVPFVVSTYNKPNKVRDYMKDHLLYYFGFYSQEDIAQTYYYKELEGSKNTINILQNIPKNKSVSIWANFSLGSFVAFRNDIWNFPMCYDIVDYLLIQKNATSTCFEAKELSELDYRQDSIKYSYFAKAYKNGTMVGRTTNMITPIKHLLVDSLQTHKIAQETEHLLLLERKEHFEIPMPASTVGFGWLRILGFHKH